MQTIIWLILMVAFLLTEAATVAMVSLWFAAGSLAAMVASLLGAPIWLQVALFLAVAAVLLASLRPLVRKHFTPRLSRTNVDEIHTIAISHGEGRFVGPEKLLRELAAKGQIATQYVDLAGNASMDMRFNPNASYFAIEGITSPDGRVLGKMGHTERSGENLYKNVPGDKYQPLFEGGVEYFL